MNLKFDAKSRAEAVRSALVDVKARILAETQNFDIEFYKMDFLKNGFGFRFDVKARRGLETDPGAMQELSEIRHFAGETFDYLFNGALSVSSFSDRTSAEYEITSAY